MRNKKRLRHPAKPGKKRRLPKNTTVKTIRRLLDLKKEAIRNPDGSIARGNKKLETLRKEYSSQ